MYVGVCVCICRCVSSQCEMWISTLNHPPHRCSCLSTELGESRCGGFLGKQECGVIVCGICNMMPLVTPTTGNADFSSSWVCFQQLLEQGAWLIHISDAAMLIKQPLGQTKGHYWVQLAVTKKYNPIKWIVVWYQRKNAGNVCSTAYNNKLSRELHHI